MARVAWLIPDLLEGSGGHRTIMQHADFLQKSGHECVLYIEGRGDISGSAVAKRLEQLFGYCFKDVRCGWDAIEPADMYFATVWYSAKIVRDLPYAGKKCYFVQDFEAYFNPMGDGYIMAENSYRYGLYPITIGRWLPKVLSQFGSSASCFDFCADLDIYRPLPSVRKEKAVCFIYQPEKPRRCSQLGIEALGILKHRMPEVQIYLYGSRKKNKLWFDCEHLGLIDLESCNRLYNRCAVGLCISTTNPSRIPFEMMASGLPVVEVYRDSTLYDLPEEAVLLAEPTPESLAEGMIRLLNEPSLAAEMGRAGIDFMKDRTLNFGLEQFLQSVNTLLAGDMPAPVPVQIMYHPPMLVAQASDVSLVDPGRSSDIYDPGRLARLPNVIKKPLRMVYRTVRKYL